MADVTIPSACNKFGNLATGQAQGVLDGAVNGTKRAGVVADLAAEARGKGALPNQVLDTLRCTQDAYRGDPRANDIRSAGNMYSVLSGGTTAGFR